MTRRDAVCGWPCGRCRRWRRLLVGLLLALAPLLAAAERDEAETAKDQGALSGRSRRPVARTAPAVALVTDGDDGAVGGRRGSGGAAGVRRDGGGGGGAALVEIGHDKAYGKRAPNDDIAQAHKQAEDHIDTLKSQKEQVGKSIAEMQQQLNGEDSKLQELKAQESNQRNAVYILEQKLRSLYELQKTLANRDEELREDNVVNAAIIKFQAERRLKDAQHVGGKYAVEGGAPQVPTERHTVG